MFSTKITYGVYLTMKVSYHAMTDVKGQKYIKFVLHLPLS